MTIVPGTSMPQSIGPKHYRLSSQRLPARAYPGDRADYVWLGLILIALFALGCSKPRSLTEEERRQVAELNSELTQLTIDLSNAEREQALYSSGLIKTLISVRLELLKSTQVLLRQRILAIESGAPATVGIAVTTPDPGRANALEGEIAAQLRKVQVARIEAGQYSGGLLGSLKATTVASEEQTLALLRQQHLVAKYGLSWPQLGQRSGATTGSDSASSPVQAPTPSSPSSEPVLSQAPPTPAPVPFFQVVGIESKVTESNSSWSRFAWKLVIRNPSDRSISLDATMEFQDEEGFVVDEDRQYRLTLDPNQERTFTGYKLIDAKSVGKVKQVNAKVTPR